MKKLITIIFIICVASCNPIKQIQRSQKRIDAVKKLFPCECPLKLQPIQDDWKWDGGTIMLTPYYDSTSKFIIDSGTYLPAHSKITLL